MALLKCIMYELYRVLIEDSPQATQTLSIPLVGSSVLRNTGYPRNSTVYYS